jgi:hypothetical protein
MYKIDNSDNRFCKKKIDAKWYQFWKTEFVNSPIYSIVLKYGTNQLKWIEGHHEYSDMIASSFYVEGHHKNDITDIVINYCSIEERNNEYDKIYAELNFSN